MFHYAVVASLILLGLVLRVLASAPYGRALRASRENPVRATSLGYDVTRIRLAAYTVSGAGGGLAGVLVRQQQPVRQPFHPGTGATPAKS